MAVYHQVIPDNASGRRKITKEYVLKTLISNIMRYNEKGVDLRYQIGDYIIYL